jgi:hypothetical protein
MVGPALFVAVFTLEGRLRPGYNPLSMYVSELSLGPLGWIQIANFVIVGVLLLVFARGVAVEFQDGRASRAGPLLLAIVGFSLLVSGPFVMDPTSTPREQWSWHGTLHQLFGALVFSIAPVSCIVFWRRFRNDPTWRSFQGWTLAAGVIVAVSVVLLKVGELPPNPFSPWVGLIQRVALVTYLGWVFTFALALRARNKPRG